MRDQTFPPFRRIFRSVLLSGWQNVRHLVSKDPERIADNEARDCRWFRWRRKYSLINASKSRGLFDMKGDALIKRLKKEIPVVKDGSGVGKTFVEFQFRRSKWKTRNVGEHLGGVTNLVT